MAENIETQGKGVQPAGRTETSDRRPKMGPSPRQEHPRRNRFFQQFNDMMRHFAKALTSKTAMRWLLAASVLTGFAKKETNTNTEDGAPKAVITAGTLGMTLVRAELENGNKNTDFDVRMMYAKAAKESLQATAPELAAVDPLSKETWTGVKKTAHDLLKEHSAKTTPKKTMTVAEMAAAKGGKAH